MSSEEPIQREKAEVFSQKTIVRLNFSDVLENQTDILQIVNPDDFLKLFDDVDIEFDTNSLGGELRGLEPDEREECVKDLILEILDTVWGNLQEVLTQGALITETRGIIFKFSKSDYYRYQANVKKFISVSRHSFEEDRKKGTAPDFLQGFLQGSIQRSKALLICPDAIQNLIYDNSYHIRDVKNYFTVADIERERAAHQDEMAYRKSKIKFGRRIIDVFANYIQNAFLQRKIEFQIQDNSTNSKDFYRSLARQIIWSEIQIKEG